MKGDFEMADNIYTKMLGLSSEILSVAKNLTVGTGKNAYKAAGESGVLMAVKPLEAKYGIYSYPYSRRVIDSGEIVSKAVWDGKETEKKQLYLRIETVYRFVNVEKPEEYIDITTYGDGVDTQDKATGKAMTYADKYALMKAYKIITGDDPDKEYSAPLQDVRHNLISEREKSVLISLCEKKGLSPESVFKNGVDNITVDQYLIAVEKLAK